MIALLSTNFFRIRRDLLFWLALCVCLVGGIAFGMGFRGAPAFDDFYSFLCGPVCLPLPLPGAGVRRRDLAE